MKYHKFTLGQIEAVFNKLGGEEGVERLLAGDREIVIKRHVIRVTREPHYDDEFFGLKYHETRTSSLDGLIRWDLSRLELWRPQISRSKRLQSISDINDGLQEKLILNACVRDYLLRHPDLIPTEWQEYVLCFFGTHFQDRAGRLYVPTLEYKAGSWKDVYFQFDRTFDRRFAVPLEKRLIAA